MHWSFVAQQIGGDLSFSSFVIFGFRFASCGMTVTLQSMHETAQAASLFSTYKFSQTLNVSTMKFTAALLLSLGAVANAAVPSLTPDNYGEMTDGKTVFIKFFAPWCGHCKKMAPDWEKLAGEWEGNAVGMIAEVDCTAEGKPLCDANGVRGFPTLKYGDPTALEDYQGGRSYDDLAKFATENLKPVCSPSNLDLCDADKKKQIEEYMALTEADLEAKITAEEEKLAKAESDFETAVGELQASYQKLMADKDETIAAVKASGLGLMKSVKAAKSKGGKDEL